MKNVFILGSKGIPARYGGFETFVEHLTGRKVSNDIFYHVSCMSDENNNEFTYNNSRCFNVKTPNVGSAKAVLYDILSLKQTIQYIKQNKLKNCIVYILACRIGPFFSYYKQQLGNLGVTVLVNPDGHEWKRSKWNYAIRNYWKTSERLMVKNADLVVCDSRGIEDYVLTEYKSYSPKTTFIAYGADTQKSLIKKEDKLLTDWLEKFNLKENEFFLIVGRFVPENNYKLIIEEFMSSKTKKDLVIISNVEENPFYNYLLESTHFNEDKRIKFVGTVYNEQLLKKIRELAFGYIHGHEVGGTNPSLLEALASTRLNLLLDVVFNKEVGKEGAEYFMKEKGNLSKLINKTSNYDESVINSYSIKAKSRIESEYSWEKIISEYENLFLETSD